MQRNYDVHPYEKLCVNQKVEIDKFVNTLTRFKNIRHGKSFSDFFRSGNNPLSKELQAYFGVRLRALSLGKYNEYLEQFGLLLNYVDGANNKYLISKDGVLYITFTPENEIIKDYGPEKNEVRQVNLITGGVTISGKILASNNKNEIKNDCNLDSSGSINSNENLTISKKLSHFTLFNQGNKNNSDNLKRKNVETNNTPSEHSEESKKQKIEDEKDLQIKTVLRNGTFFIKNFSYEEEMNDSWNNQDVDNENKDNGYIRMLLEK